MIAIDMSALVLAGAALAAVPVVQDGGKTTAPPPQHAGATISVVDQASEPKTQPGYVAQIPALTPVVLEVLAPLGSRISSTGDRFPLVLKEPILIDGRQVVAAGVRGEGEVVHAKKAGGSGSAGELVLAARFLTMGERQLKLRSMRIALAGSDATQKVAAFNAAAAASPLPVGLIGFAISGRNIEMPSGTVAMARTAEAFPLTAPETNAEGGPAGAPDMINK